MSADTRGRDRSPGVVIVTGAGGGLGRAISHRLLRDGFRCVLTDRNEDAVKETAALADAAADMSRLIAADIRIPEDRERLISVAVAEGGSVFGLVNSAGIGRLRPLLDETVQDWRDTIETNLEAAYFLSQRAIEHMRPQGEGRIINIASAHGIIGLDNRELGSRAPERSPGDRGPLRQSASAASKGALIQLTRDLAAAVGRWGITVNAISPGNVPRPDQVLKDEPSGMVGGSPVPQDSENGGLQATPAWRQDSGRQRKEDGDEQPSRPAWDPGGDRRSSALPAVRRRVIHHGCQPGCRRGMDHPVGRRWTSSRLRRGPRLIKSRPTSSMTSSRDGTARRPTRCSA